MCNNTKMNTKSSTALSKFKEGYNCAQSVVYAYADEMGIDENTLLSLSVGFGGGMGRKQEVCGAVSGAVMVLGAVCSKENGNNNRLSYKSVQRLIDGFTKEKGSIKCLDLLSGCNLSTSEGQSLFKEKNLRSHCDGCIEVACNILQKELL